MAAANMELGAVAAVPVSSPLNPNQIVVDEREPAAVVTLETNQRKRVPKRVLHFSDGVLEEFSSSDDDGGVDEADVNRNVVSQSLVDPAMLTWGPYLWYKMIRAGSKTLAACDYLGEHLANFFGITSPKYQFEVDDYFRQKTEEEKQRQQQEMEVKNWTSPTALQEAVAEQLSTSNEWKRY